MTPIDWDWIVIHHAAQPDRSLFDVAGIRKFHKDPPPAGRGWQDIGYHYLVDRVNDETECILGRPLTMHGSHAPDHGFNRKGIGICFVGNFNEVAPSTEMLYVAVTRLIRPLCYAYGIPKNQIIGHKDTGKATDCPGKMFDLDELRAMV